MSESPILSTRHGRVGVITLNRPAQLNALNDALMDAMGQALLDLDADPDIGAIVITGSDKAFAAGADIAVMADWSYMDVFQSGFITRNWETIRQVRKPVVAAVAGYAMGGGLRIGTGLRHRDRRRVGTVCIARNQAGHAARRRRHAALPRAIGKAKAMDMCLSARMLNAQEADRYGLVSRVVPDADLQSTALKLATQIGGYSLPALMAIKESVNRAHESSLSEGILFERALHARFASDDAHDRHACFLGQAQTCFPAPLTLHHHGPRHRIL